MQTTAQDIDALLQLRSEHERLEFKAATNRYDFEALVDYCVALANEGGGRMVLGITDQAPRRVVGTQAFAVPERTVAGLFDRLHLKVSWEEVAHPHGRVLIFHVPSRPIGQPLQHRGRYLMRIGEQLAPMSPDVLRSILAEGEPDWELLPAKSGCDGETVACLLDVQSYFDLMGLPQPATRNAMLDRLRREGLLDQDGDGWRITNMGAILFAKNLEDFDQLGRKAPRVVVYEGLGKFHARLDRHKTRGYASGFNELVDFVNALTPAAEEFRNGLRRELRAYPEVAVRELIANALIHQDFGDRGALVAIELYSDRIEISNAGLPSISPDRFIDEYQARNSRLSNLMRRLGICEERGSGIDMVVEAAEAFGLPAPDFRVGEKRTTAILFTAKAFSVMDLQERIRAAYQHCCLRYVMNQKMTNRSLRERFKLESRQSGVVSRVIAAALAAGAIKADEANGASSRTRRYLPAWA